MGGRSSQSGKRIYRGSVFRHREKRKSPEKNTTPTCAFFRKRLRNEGGDKNPAAAVQKLRTVWRGKKTFLSSDTLSREKKKNFWVEIYGTQHH